MELFKFVIQVLSTIVLNLTPKGKALINMESTSKISSADWQTCEPRAWIAGGSPLPNSNAMTESQVVFRCEFVESFDLQ